MCLRNDLQWIATMHHVSPCALCLCTHTHHTLDLDCASISTSTTQGNKGFAESIRQENFAESICQENFAKEKEIEGYRYPPNSI